MSARTRRKGPGAPRQIGMPWAAPTVRTDVDARPGPEKVGRLHRWTPRHVWTLHLVPGRPNGPPLAVRRRCIDDWDDVLHFEIARHRSGAVSIEDFDRNGIARAFDSARYDGTIIELGLLVYDHRPTAEERAEWLRIRRIERAVLRKPPTHVWLAGPGKAKGGPDRAVRCPGALYRADGYWADRFQYEVRPPAWKRPKEGEVRSPCDVNLVLLTTEGPQTARLDGVDVRVYLEKPSADELARLGRERAERDAQEARQKEEARRFAESFARVREMAERQKEERAAALKTLGLDATATAADVQRAYRRTIAAEGAHPDQGGAVARFEELTRARDAALAAVEGRA